MAARHGRNGRIMLDTSSAGNGSAVAISKKNKWSVDGSVDKVDTTSFGDTTKTNVTGLPNNSGDFGGFWDDSDTLIFNSWGSSVARKLYLYPDFSNDVGVYYFTTAFVDLKVDVGVSEAVGMTGSWTGATSGAWVTA